MVKGWQNRVELADARRVASKQKRSKQTNRSAYKALVHDLVAFLDTHDYEIRKSTLRQHLQDDDVVASSALTLHIWLDSSAAQQQGNAITLSPPADMYEETGNTGKEKGKRKGGGGKKKGHPRSNKESDASGEGEPSNAAPRLCRNQFYHETCQDMNKAKGKKQSQAGGCRNFHYPKHHKTLATVLKNKGDSKSKKNRVSGADEVLTVCEEQMVEATAAETSSADAEIGGMEMVYYISAKVSSNDTKDDGTPPSLSISEALTRALADASVGIASVVYVALNHVFLFDRYRSGGLVVSDLLQLKLKPTAATSTPGSSSEGCEIEHGNDKTTASDVVGTASIGDLLPGPILECILTFLPDTAVTRMSGVCKHWNSEIGTTSPELWRQLLKRRNWPIVLDDADADTGNTNVDFVRERLKADFLLHYSVVRDVQAVKDSLSAMMNTSSANNNDETTPEMAFQLFSARQSAPQRPNGCIEVQVWSPNQILAGYKQDCTLRLFQAVDKCSPEHQAAGSTSSPHPASPSRACREVASVCIDPYRNTKKQRCRLVAMGLDEETIACLCHVQAQTHQKAESFKLVVITRENFLCANGSTTVLEDGVFKVIDVGEAVLYYLLSLDHEVAGPRLLSLFDFLTNGGDVEHVEVIASQSVVACGYGRFLFEVSISLPEALLGLDDDDATTMGSMMLLDRKLVLFSANDGAIVWMGDSSPSRAPPPRHVDMTISCLRRPEEGRSRQACSIAVTSASSPTILFTDIASSGHVQNVQSIEAAEIVRNEILIDSWELQPSHSRALVVMDSDILVADCLFEETDDDRRLFKSVISIYPRFGDGSAYEIMEIEGNSEVVRMKALRDQHVVALLRFHANAEEASLVAILVHVPSRRVIHRLGLTKDVSICEASPTYDLPLFFCSAGDTVGIGLWWKGIVMTGADVRAVGSSDAIAGEAIDGTPKGGKRKKKVKRQPIRKNVRGMSLRNAAS
eukprot:CAMPEP_0119032816 /NCGR_PEP_ID=MMETSP1176-20130426/42242_1 /TAXON_ID=265551 /ORGANISM="Synedropsis recta cf, Strain CCMP1620" /LENGTH=970 /DNA_ID=CAMNT_0006989231 /DNA_START=42 /DNA_END=2954 /DNA_ORIENTATION=-